MCEITEMTIYTADLDRGLESPPLQLQQIQGGLSGSLFSQTALDGGAVEGGEWGMEAILRGH